MEEVVMPPPDERHRFTELEMELVNKCIDAVESRAKELRAKGLTTRNFVFGVANSLFVAWSIGALPQNFWIVYLLEVAILFPLRWRNMVRARPKEHFFWLDFCWVANFVGVAIILLLATGHNMPIAVHRTLFCTAWGLGNGPLLSATGLLGNALIFHDFDNTASVIIHLLPSLVMFSVGWHEEAVNRAWPDIFMRIGFLELDPWRDIYLSAAAGYMAVWWVPYLAWLLTWGMALPERGYDTLFHSTMRTHGAILYSWMGKSKQEFARRREENSFTRADAVAYMCVHAAFVLAGICVSLVCFLNQWVHVTMCGLMTLSTIVHAANRYTYYMLINYGRVVRQGLGIPMDRRGSALLDELLA